MDTKIFRHFRGGFYKVIANALDSSNSDRLVVYQELGRKGLVWVRPHDEFYGTVQGVSDRFTPIKVRERIDVTSMEGNDIVTVQYTDLKHKSLIAMNMPLERLMTEGI